MSIPLISIQNLNKSFGKKNVLHNFSLEVSEGESFVVIGSSGTGKSVLIKCILGLLPFDTGKIYIKGKDVSKLTLKERQGLLSRASMLFQGGALFDSMSVVENIAFGLIHGKGIPKKEALLISMEKLKAVDLSLNIANTYPAELSGGMQKRVALARAIAKDPEIIFFDEPTTGLDPIISGTINDLIIKCVRNLGASAITITHDMNSLRKIADRVGLLFQGNLVWTGSVPELNSTDNPYIYQFINGLPEGPFTEKQV